MIVPNKNCSELNRKNVLSCENHTGQQKEWEKNWHGRNFIGKCSFSTSKYIGIHGSKITVYYNKILISSQAIPERLATLFEDNSSNKHYTQDFLAYKTEKWV